MSDSLWDYIYKVASLPQVDSSTVAAFAALRNGQQKYVKGEGALRHCCSFFLPYDVDLGKIYLGWHKKANDWIPPGGHLEKGESPKDAAIREMKEELDVVITPELIEPWTLSVKEIGRPQMGCEAHYDIWHLVHIKEQHFNFDPGEYYDAAWFSIEQGASKIAHNPDFADIVRQLSR